MRMHRDTFALIRSRVLPFMRKREADHDPKHSDVRIRWDAYNDMLDAKVATYKETSEGGTLKDSHVCTALKKIQQEVRDERD